MIEALGHRGDRAENLQVILGRIGLDTDEAGSFRRPLRDAAGDTARWVVSLSISWRTAHRCIVELEALGLIVSGVCFRNPSGPRPRRSWRPTTRPRLPARPNVANHDTRQPCGCGRWWLRWHAGRLDARCRRCHRSAALRAHRERTLPISLAPKCHTKEQGSSLTRSSRSVTARSPTRGRQHRKSQTGVPVQRQAPRGSPRPSPCFEGAVDSWLTDQRCQNPQCSHRVPSRPDPGDERGPNRWCRCCWRRGRDAVPPLSAAERYQRDGMPQELIDFVTGDGPEPSIEEVARIERQQAEGRRRLDELLAAHPVGPRPPAGDDHTLKRQALTRALETITADPGSGGRLRRCGAVPQCAAMPGSPGAPEPPDPPPKAPVPPPEPVPPPDRSGTGEPPPPGEPPRRQPAPDDEPPEDPDPSAGGDGSGPLPLGEQLRRVRALRAKLRPAPSYPPRQEPHPAGDADHREALADTRARAARSRAERIEALRAAAAGSEPADPDDIAAAPGAGTGDADPKSGT